MQRFTSLNRNQGNHTYGSQVIVPHSQPDNLEKQIREQLQYLKKSANVSSGNANQQTFFDIQQNNHFRQLRVKEKESIKAQQDQQNIKQSNNQNEQNITMNNQKQIKIEKENTRQQQVVQTSSKTSETDRQKSINAIHSLQNGINSLQNASMTQSPSRKKSNNYYNNNNNNNNCKIAHQFVESRYGAESNPKGSYLFKRLKHKLDESDTHSFYNENSINKLQERSLIPLDKSQPLTILNKDQGKSMNQQQQQQQQKYQNDNNMKNQIISNINTQYSNNKSSLRQSKIEDNISLISSLPDKSYYQPYKKNSLYQSPLKSQNLYGKSQKDYSSLRRPNNSQNNQINPYLARRNNNNNNYMNISQTGIKNNNNNNKIIQSDINAQENILQQQLNQQVKTKQQQINQKQSQPKEQQTQQYNQNLQQINQQQQQDVQLETEQRKTSSFKNQQEIENIFKETKEQLYANQIETLSNVGKHILKQRETYFNNYHNNFSIHLPEKDIEPVPPLFTQESQAFATQGSIHVADMYQPYKKMSAHEFLNGEQQAQFVANNQIYRLKQKKVKNSELVRMSKGQNGSIILQGSNDKERNILSKCNYDQTLQKDKSTVMSQSNKSSIKCLYKKKIKKVNSRYINQSVINSQDGQKSQLQDILHNGVHISSSKYPNNNQQQSEQTTFRVLEKHAAQFDQAGTHSNNDSGLIIYNCVDEDALENNQQKLIINQLVDKKNIQTHDNPLSQQEQEDLFDVKVNFKQNQNLFKLQSYPKINHNGEDKNNQNLIKTLQNNNQGEEDDDDNHDEEDDDEGDDDDDENEDDSDEDEDQQEAYDEIQSNLVHNNVSNEKMKGYPKYIEGQLADTVQRNGQIGLSRTLKKDRCADQFNRKYNIDISVDDNASTCNISKNKNKKKKKIKNKKTKKVSKKSKKNKTKTIIIGADDKKYKIKIYKNIMGIYCAQKQLFLSEEKAKALSH